MSYDFTVRPANAGYEVFEYNITYNVGTMMRRAGFHANIVNGMKVSDLKPIVEHAYQILEDNPQGYFDQFQPPNGWGSYGGVLKFMGELDQYLQEAPDHYVMVVT
jgi:hypothetical protein